MPEISIFCPRCGRSVSSRGGITAAPLKAEGHRDAILGGLAYIALLPAIVFLAVPALNASKFVRFHSWQSVMFSVGTVIAGLLMRLIFAVLSVVPWVGFLFAWLSIGLVSLAIVVLWAVLLVKAAQGEGYEIPWISRLVERLAQ